jgi:hypothetical protein
MEQNLLDVVAEPVPDVTVLVRLQEEDNVTEPIQQEMPPPCGRLEERHRTGGDVSGGQWIKHQMGRSAYRHQLQPRTPATRIRAPGGRAAGQQNSREQDEGKPSTPVDP